MSQLGLALQREALEQSREGREERIAMVRGWLLAYYRDMSSATLTGDEVMDAVEALGFADGDRRWTAAVLKGWWAVTPTGQYEVSRRPECHARPKLVWRFR